MIKIKAGGPEISLPRELIFLGLHVDNPTRTRASFYDWLMWRLDELQYAWEYDYSQNIYTISPKPLPAKPFEIFASDIAEIITHRVQGRFFTESLMNDYAPAARTSPILNLQAFMNMRQDRLFHTAVQSQFDAEWLKRFGEFRQPTAELLLYFKRFPSRPFPPGVGLDFKLDPIDFPTHRFLIPKEAKKDNRVYRMLFSAESQETDVLPRFDGYSGGLFNCRLAVYLQTSKDLSARLPDYVEPQYPLELEGLVHTDIGSPGTQVYQHYVDPVTSIPYYYIELPLFDNQIVRTEFIPNTFPGHFYFPAYRKERVLINLHAERAELKRFLDWRPGAQMPLSTQGNQILMGKAQGNGAFLRLTYNGDEPTFWIQRQYKTQQYICLYEGGIAMSTQPKVPPTPPPGGKAPVETTAARTAAGTPAAPKGRAHTVRAAPVGMATLPVRPRKSAPQNRRPRSAKSPAASPSSSKSPRSRPGGAASSPAPAVAKTGRQLPNPERTKANLSARQMTRRQVPLQDRRRTIETRRIDRRQPAKRRRPAHRPELVIRPRRRPHGPHNRRRPHGPHNRRRPHGPHNRRRPHGPHNRRRPHGPHNRRRPQRSRPYRRLVIPDCTRSWMGSKRLLSAPRLNRGASSSAPCRAP